MQLTTMLESATTFGRDTLFKIGFISLGYVDLLLTLVAMRRGFTEINPIMAWMLGYPVVLLLAKVAAPVVIAWLVPGRLLSPSIALLSAILGWNVARLLAP